MKVKVQLTIDHVENLNATEIEEGCPFMVKIGWVRSKRRMRYLGENAKRNQTSSKPIQADGVVRWNEEFDYVIKLKTTKTEGYKSRFLYLKVQEGKNDLRPKSLIAPTAKIDITEDLVIGFKRTVRVSVDCRIRGKISTVILEVSLQITERQVQLRRRFSFQRATSLLLFSCSGVENCVPSIHNTRASQGRNFSTTSLEDFTPRPRNQSIDCSSSEGEPEPSYKNLKLLNSLSNQLEFQSEEDDDHHNHLMYRSGLSLSPDISTHKNQEEKNQYPIKRLLSRVISSKKDEQPRGVPLLNKSCSDIGGDDIDIQRHKESDTSHISGNPRRSKVHPEEMLRISGFGEDELPFEVGNWERRSIFSRDGELELLTDVFLATIDQRSEKASGGSACTVLAVVIADWLHRNPVNLPLRCQLDQLVHEGSIIWRGLCQDENHRERFSDQHFDLETVLKEKITPLKEVVSYVGFLGMEELREDVNLLEGKMSFDFIWDEILRDSMKMAYQVYICSWNDHFFVVKIERDAIYLIDTFGERLFEGCNQAYILKFDKDSIIYRHKIGVSTRTPTEGGGSVGSSEVSTKEGNRDAEENKVVVNCEEPKPCEEDNMENHKIKHYLAKEAIGNGEQFSDEVPSAEKIISEDSKTCSNEEIERKEVISEGMETCREYIKEFLASLPVRQLKMEIRKGSIIEDRMIYQRLQIDFHYVAPCTSTMD